MKHGTINSSFLPDIQVIDIAEEGKGVGRSGDVVVFIDHAIPGDIVDVKLTRKKKKFYEGKIHRLIRPSEHRTESFCTHFGTCGGCKWQHMDYSAQLKFKQKAVVDALQRLGGVDTSAIEPILPSKKSQYYRNKLEYTFSDKRWLTNEDIQSNEKLEMNALGFHIPGRFDKILDIEHCYLQQSPSNEIRNQVRDYALTNGLSFYNLKDHTGALRNLIIRIASTGEIMLVVVFAYATQEQIHQMMYFLKDRFPEITSLLYIINQKKNDTIFDQTIELFSGRDHIFEEMDGLKFKISAKSFYQTNSNQAYELYQIVKEFASFQGNEIVYDLYTGAGTIANFIASSVKAVIGIEYVPTAIEDAKINSSINNIHNTRFYAGDMKDILTVDFVQTHGKPDIIITDPPRAGMHTDVVQRLLEIEAQKIVYVSCNAATQARDIGLLNEKYTVSRIRPVDMFPHTQHVENVILLVLKRHDYA
ncbi:MAG: 23S rRNA (uracil(1939)-C(5))-methyltransferase RlmD [Pedobacter sp.]|nr:MAG: 23S rRNA (uracil(1939)-C(5))-methyltransferase RlmD [Pedobacter sp.]